MSKSGILNDLLSDLPENPIPVRSVHVGVHWTAVCSARCGLATTITGDKPHDHTTFIRDVGSLHKKSAQELAGYALSDNPLEASIGVASINSMLEPDESKAVNINASEVLKEKGTGKNMAIVGHFPFIPKLKPITKNLWVIEQHPVGDDYNADSADELIPKADVVALTASALINHTLDDLLGLCRPDSLVMILGPSTPLSHVMFDHGANIIAGSIVIDERSVLNYIGQGATFQEVSGVRLLSFTNM